MVKRNDGFTLIELMIVIAIIAIIAAIAIPNLLSARLSANESNAISTLRNMVTSQAQFQSSSAIDADADGTGEYGSFAEMSGKCNLTRGVAGAGPLNPPILPATFASISALGFCTKSGYLFEMFLPNALGPPVTGVHDLANGAVPVGIHTDNCEAMWCCYAWPIDLNTTGNRAFFVNQRGEILQTKMTVVQYSGPGAPPAMGAAFTAADMSAPIALPPAAAVDGNVWTPLG